MSVTGLIGLAANVASIISSTGVVITLLIYIKQKKDNKKNKEDDAMNMAAMAISFLKEDLPIITSRLEQNTHELMTIKDSHIHLLSATKGSSTVYLACTSFDQNSSFKMTKVIHTNIGSNLNDYPKLMYGANKYKDLIIKIYDLIYIVSKCNIQSEKISTLNITNHEDKNIFLSQIETSTNLNKFAIEKSNEIQKLISIPPID